MVSKVKTLLFTFVVPMLLCADDVPMLVNDMETDVPSRSHDADAE